MNLEGKEEKLWSPISTRLIQNFQLVNVLSTKYKCQSQSRWKCEILSIMDLFFPKYLWLLPASGKFSGLEFPFFL